jgi:hypothetical protein
VSVISLIQQMNGLRRKDVATRGNAGIQNKKLSENRQCNNLLFPDLILDVAVPKIKNVF